MGCGVSTSARTANAPVGAKNRQSGRNSFGLGEPPTRAGSKQKAKERMNQQYLTMIQDSDITQMITESTKIRDQLQGAEAQLYNSLGASLCKNSSYDLVCQLLFQVISANHAGSILGTHPQHQSLYPYLTFEALKAADEEYQIFQRYNQLVIKESMSRLKDIETEIRSYRLSFIELKKKQDLRDKDLISGTGGDTECDVSGNQRHSYNTGRLDPTDRSQTRRLVEYLFTQEMRVAELSLYCSTIEKSWIRNVRSLQDALSIDAIDEIGLAAFKCKLKTGRDIALRFHKSDLIDRKKSQKGENR
mmetsp:Transcript_30724/g.34963  ORF Transcript_30724/g.34963 Transcript_30724/m.34963 type:complete len:303 (+) Transcript_30724:25-933(+)